MCSAICSVTKGEMVFAIPPLSFNRSSCAKTHTPEKMHVARLLVSAEAHVRTTCFANTRVPSEGLLKTLELRLGVCDPLYQRSARCEQQSKCQINIQVPIFMNLCFLLCFAEYGFKKCSYMKLAPKPKAYPQRSPFQEDFSVNNLSNPTMTND